MNNVQHKYLTFVKEKEGSIFTDYKYIPDKNNNSDYYKPPVGDYCTYKFHGMLKTAGIFQVGSMYDLLILLIKQSNDDNANVFDIDVFVKYVQNYNSCFGKKTVLQSFAFLHYANVLDFVLDKEGNYRVWFFKPEKFINFDNKKVVNNLYQFVKQKKINSVDDILKYKNELPRN